MIYEENPSKNARCAHQAIPFLHGHTQSGKKRHRTILLNTRNERAGNLYAEKTADPVQHPSIHAFPGL